MEGGSMNEITQTGDPGRTEMAERFMGRTVAPAKADKLWLPSGRGIAVDSITTWTPRSDGELNVTTIDGRENIYSAADGAAILAALREVRFA
jgi:hypothetical protein